MRQLADSVELPCRKTLIQYPKFSKSENDCQIMEVSRIELPSELYQGPALTTMLHPLKLNIF